MTTVKRVPQANRDLDDCYDYLEQEAGIVVADRFTGCVEQAFSQLAEYPEMGEVLPVTSRSTEGMRFLRVKDFKKYLIFYLPLESGRRRNVEIVRVGHSSQNWMKILGIK